MSNGFYKKTTFIKKDLPDDQNKQKKIISNGVDDIINNLKEVNLSNKNSKIDSDVREAIIDFLKNKYKR